MGCKCNRKIYGEPTPPQTQNCLCINDVIVGCDKGPKPCGGADGTMVINLAEYNDVTASPCDVVYILKEYETEGFDSVSLTDEGILTIVTSSNFEKYKQYCITYKVDSPCSLLSDEADVLICMDDPCKGKICDNKCDPCTGECIPLEPEVSVKRVNLVNNEITLK